MLVRRLMVQCTLGILTVLAAPLRAQTVAAPRSPKPPSDSVLIVMDSMRFRLDTLRSRAYFFRDSMQPMMAQAFATRRVRIGVVVSTEPGDADSIGARLDGVTPGGPAATAGLRAGDIITVFDNTPLVAQLAKVPPGTRVPSPGFKLIELVAKLPPNDTVPVEYRRGKKLVKAQVVTAAVPENLSVVVGPGGNYGFRTMPGVEAYWVGPGTEENQRALELALLRSEAVRGSRDHLDLTFSLSMSSALRGLELAPVNPQLGSYFGTTDGVLVVDVPDPPPLGLKAGDVVLAVDGREVSSPRQLMRVLSSYEPGEALRLEAMRQKKRITLRGTLGR
jgi:predicted metalloprotease with PDZ domain